MAYVTHAGRTGLLSHYRLTPCIVFLCPRRQRQQEIFHRQRQSSYPEAAPSAGVQCERHGTTCSGRCDQHERCPGRGGCSPHRRSWSRGETRGIIHGRRRRGELRCFCAPAASCSLPHLSLHSRKANGEGEPGADNQTAPQPAVAGAAEPPTDAAEAPAPSAALAAPPSGGWWIQHAAWDCESPHLTRECFVGLRAHYLRRQTTPKPAARAAERSGYRRITPNCCSGGCRGKQLELDCGSHKLDEWDGGRGRGERD